MGLSNVHDEKSPRKRSAARLSRRHASKKPLSRMTKAEIEALPEAQFTRLLKPEVRRAYLAAKRLKGVF